MANGNPGYISPSQQSYPPKRQRVAELRKIFETDPADKPYRHHKPGSSRDRSHGRDYNQGYGEYDNYGPTTEYPASPRKFDVPGPSRERSHEADYGQGFRKYDADIPNYESTEYYGPTTEYPDSPEEFEEPYPSESARDDDFEDYQPRGILKNPKTSFADEKAQKLSPKKNNTPQTSMERYRRALEWLNRRQLNSTPNRQRVGHTRRSTDSDSFPDYGGSGLTDYGSQISASIDEKPIKSRGFTDRSFPDYGGSGLTDYGSQISESIDEKPIKSRGFTARSFPDYGGTGFIDYGSQISESDDSIESFDWKPNVPGRSADSEFPFDFEGEPSFSGVLESTRIDGDVDYDRRDEHYQAPYPLSFDINQPQNIKASQETRKNKKKRKSSIRSRMAGLGMKIRLFIGIPS